MKRKPPFLILVLIVLTVLLGAASGPIGNAIELPSSLKPFAPVLFICLTFLLSLIALSQYFLQQEQTSAPASPISQQNRERLLARVRQFWITGVLDQSLHGAALIALGLQNRPDVLDNPWHLVIQQQNQPTRSLPTGTRISQVYDEANGELLILGEPGCGKTTLLLELTRDLLNRAERDERLPVPMVFPLSSWAVKRQPLADWLVEEMNTKYQIPRRLAQAWVNGDQILPLLNGLDEIAETHREACARNINTFRQEHGLVPMVVCSRSTEYLDLKQHLHLDYAVVVQPLTDQQINEYLSSGEQMERVRAALKDDVVLREMARTPLFLSVMTLAYHERAVRDAVVLKSIEEYRQRLFDDYVTEMLQRRGHEKRYSTQQTISWLSWLARQMLKHDQSEFFLERLQSDWLTGTRSRIVYYIAVVFLLGLVVGLSWGLCIWLGSPLPDKFVTGLIAGSLGVVAGGLLAGLKMKIKPAEAITWTRNRIGVGLFTGLFIWLFLGLLIVLFGGLNTNLGIKLLAGLLVGLFFGLSIGLLAGLSSEMLDTRHLDKPNRGIWRSARYAMIFWLLLESFGALFFGLLFGLSFGLPFTLRIGLPVGLLIGLPVGIVGGLLYGGIAFFQHFILRWFLWRAGYMPWNYARFLDYATDRIFLRKVGGGYTFVHRLLLEHFATRTDGSLSTEKKSGMTPLN